MKASFIFPLLCVACWSVAQSRLPVIKATSAKVTINDGGFVDQNAWTLSPQIRPDVFTADRTRETKWITFYTNIDSIRVKVRPGTRFNFVVLLNGKDSCYTQIASAIPPEANSTAPGVKNDTIPFTLTAYNAIQIKAILDRTDTLDVHFDASSFGFHILREVILKKTKLLAGQPDALSGKIAPNYNRLAHLSHLQMGSAQWTNPEVLPTAVTAHEMDGRLGWTWFEGKTVSLDYDSSQLIISNNVPRSLKGYTKEKIKFIRSLPCVKGMFEINGKLYTGYFGLDNGSEQAMVLDGVWRQQQSFPENLKLLKSLEIRDANGNKYETRLVKAPVFKLGGQKLKDTPALLIGRRSMGGIPINYLGNDLLKRFNIILDFKHDCIYWKPNKLFEVAYRKV